MGLPRGLLFLTLVLVKEEEAVVGQELQDLLDQSVVLEQQDLLD
jgi:hypothetical protein